MAAPDAPLFRALYRRRRQGRAIHFKYSQRAFRNADSVFFAFFAVNLKKSHKTLLKLDNADGVVFINRPFGLICQDSFSKVK
jgi:hypothetical protein